MRTHRSIVSLATLALLLLAALAPVAAFQADPPAAPVVNDEGGPIMVSGTVTISNPNIKISSSQPLVMLEDQAGFVDRDFNFTFPLKSQVLGRFTSDFYADGPIGYDVFLPAEPQGSVRDVDLDGQADLGVQIYQVALWDNRFGDIYLEPRDGFGWSSAFSTARVSNDPRRLGELEGGYLVVYASDDQQGFPSGFGEDKLLFTADDPIVRLPRGYTLVNLDTDPFTFDRSRKPVVNLIEPEEAVPDDFSALSYTQAFDALIAKARKEYAFTQEKGIDWDALSARLRPQFEEAEAKGDINLYQQAVYDLVISIPDGHVGATSYPNFGVIDAGRQRQIEGGLGFAIRELTDGRLLVNFVLEDGPAFRAGIRFGAEITSIGGQPIDAAIRAVKSVNAPYSSPVIERLDQVRFVTRFPVGTSVEVIYRNPGASSESTADLTAVRERDSLSFSRRYVYSELASFLVAPVEFRFLDSGIGYVTVNDFFGNEPLMIHTWEFFLNMANQVGAPGIIIDLRTNSGGFSNIGYRMASYLFNEEIPIEFSLAYNKEIDDFFYDPRVPEKIMPEPDPSKRFSGPVAVLVGPDCASACEFFAYALSLKGRSAVVGQYPTRGIGGGWTGTNMPDGVVFALPTNRPTDEAGKVIIEGPGIVPTVLVPVTEDNMATEEDVVLQAAIDHLTKASR